MRTYRLLVVFAKVGTILVAKISQISIFGLEDRLLNPLLFLLFAHYNDKNVYS